MVVFELTLIRHGETDFNRQQIVQGQRDEPLSEAGVRQAELLGLRLQHQRYSHVFSSDLKRAFLTAEGILRHNKSFSEQTVKPPLIWDERLRERKMGVMEGIKFKHLTKAAAKSSQSCTQYTPEGGETLQQLRERAVSFFRDICHMVLENSDLRFSNAAAVVDRIDSTGSIQRKNVKRGGQKRKRGNIEIESREGLQASCNNKMNFKDTDRSIFEKVKPTNESNCIHGDCDAINGGRGTDRPILIKKLEGTSKIVIDAGLSNKTVSSLNASEINITSSKNLSDSICSTFPQKCDEDFLIFTSDDISSQTTSNYYDFSSENYSNTPINVKQIDSGNPSPVTLSYNFLSRDDCSIVPLKPAADQNLIAPHVKITNNDIPSQLTTSRSDFSNGECPNIASTAAVHQRFPTSHVVGKDDLSSRITSSCNYCSPYSTPTVEQNTSDDYSNVSSIPAAVQDINSSSALCTIPNNISQRKLQHEHQLSVFSGFSDVADSILEANILVVSHWGWLRELFWHIFQDLECSVPNGRKYMFQPIADTGLSKFIVSVEKNNGAPKVVCLQLNDKQHLVSTS